MVVLRNLSRCKLCFLHLSPFSLLQKIISKLGSDIVFEISTFCVKEETEEVPYTAS